MTRIAVLEVGGTHTAASWVQTHGWHVAAGPHRAASGRPDASAAELLDGFAAGLAPLGSVHGAPLAVAIPGPFDYDTGIGRFRDVGKFDALAGVDVGAGLRERLGRHAPERIAFVNDAAAFGVGAWLAAGDGRRRVVAITLGTGVGSAFVDAGTVVSTGPTVPPDGHVYRLAIDGRPLESVVSRRAIIARYGAAEGSSPADVAEIATRAAGGDPRAQRAFLEPIRSLGTALAPWLERFAADLLVVGGGMSRSWSLVHDALRDGLAAANAGHAAIAIERARDPETATALGAAWHAVGGVPS